MPIVTYGRNSVYANTPQNSSYLGYWNPPAIWPTSQDSYMVLPQKYKHRPDLLSFDLYGTPSLWWIFAMLNPNILKDPVFDMQPGIELRVPSNTTVQGYL